MGYIRSFDDFAPPARFDDTPFTEARVQESAGPNGPWETIETVPLDPVDDDPENPVRRDFTTTNAELNPVAWYRIVWADNGGNEFLSVPIRWDDSAASIASVDDVLRVLRIDEVSEDDAARIIDAIRVAESWARRATRDPNLGSTATEVVEVWQGETVIPYTGDVVAIEGIPYPGADPVPIDPDLYWDSGDRIRILSTSWVWPGLPQWEQGLSATLSNWQIRVTTDRSGVEVDPLVRDAVAYAAAALWTRGPRLGKGVTGERIGDYSYSVAALREGDPFFEEARSLLRQLPRRRSGLVV